MFRKALREGDISFSFKKKDGTVREVLHGTMYSQLLPKTEPSRKIKIKDITSSDDKKLPKCMTVFVTEAAIEKLGIHDAVTAALEVKCGGKFNGSYTYFEADEKPTKKLPKETIFFYDIDKQSYRSFNESQLIDWSK